MLFCKKILLGACIIRKQKLLLVIINLKTMLLTFHSKTIDCAHQACENK